MSSNVRTVTISAKLWVLTVFVSVALIVLGASGLLLLRDKMYEDRLLELRAIVDVALSIAADLDKDVKAGQLSQDEALKRFQKSAGAMRYNGGQDYVFAYTMEGVTVVAPDASTIGTSRLDNVTSGRRIVRELRDGVRDKGEIVLEYELAKPGEKKLQHKISYAAAFQPWGLVVGTGVYVDDIDAAFAPLAWTLAAGILGLSAVAALAALLIGRSIRRPLGALEGKMRRLAAGELEIEITEAARGDEIGQMAKAVEVFKANALENRRLRLEQEEAEQRASVERRAAMLALAGEFEKSVGGIVDSVSSAAAEMQATAQSMASTADQAKGRAADMTTAAGQATAKVHSVAAAAEELASSVQEIARQVAQSSQIAAKAVGEVERTDVSVQSLNESAQKIGEVVGLIQDIASQTNLLALNATIEAARAGEAGKGFAVVASEVKALANQTAKATEEIAGQIAAIQGATGQAVEAIRGIGATISEIDAVSTAIASAVEQQEGATREIAGNVTQAADGTESISAGIAGVSEASAEAGAAASQVLDAASGLAQQGELLKQEVEAFLRTVRAA